MAKVVRVLIVLCTFMVPSGNAAAAADRVCPPAASASINVSATVIEPVGLVLSQANINMPRNDLNPWLLRLPESSQAIVHLTAPDRPDLTVYMAPRSGNLDKIQPGLVGRYRNGTLTVIFTDN